MIERLNRTVLALFGLLLTGIGLFGLARGYGAFGDAEADEQLLPPDIRDFVARNGDWFWPAAAVAALLLALLALKWLRAQLGGRRDRPELTWESDRGTTSIRPVAATDALADDLEGYPGIQSAAVGLSGDLQAPEVRIRVDASEDAELAVIRRQIDEHGLTRFRQALEFEDLTTTVEFRLKPAIRELR